MNKDVTHFYIPVSKSLPSALPTFSSDSDYFQAMKLMVVGILKVQMSSQSASLKGWFNISKPVM